MQNAYQMRLSVIALSGLLAILVSVPSLEAKAGISATQTREMASLSTERFKAPDPMSREYAEPSRFQDNARQTEAPVEEQSPAKPRQKPETN